MVPMKKQTQNSVVSCRDRAETRQFPSLVGNRKSSGCLVVEVFYGKGWGGPKLWNC